MVVRYFPIPLLDGPAQVQLGLGRIKNASASTTAGDSRWRELRASTAPSSGRLTALLHHDRAYAGLTGKPTRHRVQRETKRRHGTAGCYLQQHVQKRCDHRSLIFIFFFQFISTFVRRVQLPCSSDVSRLIESMARKRRSGAHPADQKKTTAGSTADAARFVAKRTRHIPEKIYFTFDRLSLRFDGRWFCVPSVMRVGI